MNRAIFAGTFDPVHSGHLSILWQACELFDEVIWAVATGEGKTPMFTLEQRLAMMNIAREDPLHDNFSIRTIPTGTTLVEFAEKYNAGWLVRSFRMNADFEYELQMSMVNRKLSPGRRVNTVFLPPYQEQLHISSTTVRTLINLKQLLSDYMPDAYAEHIYGLKYGEKFLREWRGEDE